MYRLYKFVGLAFWAVILSLIICFFVVTGGPYCIKTQFDDHELEWTKAFAMNETICYYCEQLERYDTIVVTEKKVFSPEDSWVIDFDCSECNWIEVGHTVHAHAGIEFIVNNDTNNYHSNILFIRKENEGKCATVWIYMLGNSFSEKSIDKGVNRLEWTEDDLENEAYPCQIRVTSIIWDKNEGLLEYVINGSERYVKCPKKCLKF